MRRRTTFLFVLCGLLALAAPAHSANQMWWGNCLTGGGTCLDGIPVALLNPPAGTATPGDAAVVNMDVAGTPNRTDYRLYNYASSPPAANGTSVIAPATNPGNMRWIQVPLNCTGNLCGFSASANAQTLMGHTFAQMLSDIGAQPAGSYAPASGSANYQAASSNLTTYAGIAPSANAQTLMGHTFAQMLSDIGAQPAGSYGVLGSANTWAGVQTITNASAQFPLIVNANIPAQDGGIMVATNVSGGSANLYMPNTSNGTAGNFSTGINPGTGLAEASFGVGANPHYPANYDVNSGSAVKWVVDSGSGIAIARATGWGWGGEPFASTALSVKNGASIGGTTDPGAGYLDVLHGYKVGGSALACSNLSGAGPGCSAAAGQLPGTATNDSASAGNVGEYITNSGSNVSISNGAAANITSLSLTAGEWYVFGDIGFVGTGITATTNAGGISTTSATIPGVGSQGLYYNSGGFSSNQQIAAPVGGLVVKLASTTTVYLCGIVYFSAGSCVGDGTISAVRIR